MMNRKELSDIIRGMSVEELRELIKEIKEVISEKRREIGEYEFSFHATCDPRKKGAPFVARLVWNKENDTIERHFYNLERTYGKKMVTVSGKFKACEGDIIEQREGASWKNDHRKLYVVVNGELKLVAEIQKSSDVSRVKRYLKGEITLEELLHRV